MYRFVKFWVLFPSDLYASCAHRSCKRQGGQQRKAVPTQLTAVVGVRARSVQCVARGVALNVFLRREWIRRFPGVSF